MKKLIEYLIKSMVKREAQVADDERPVKFVEEKRNVWRIVYAEEQPHFPTK